jgi:hypothetical protein
LKKICAFTFILMVCTQLLAEKQGPAAEVFQRLLSPQTTDKAAQQLLKRGKADSETRKYLAEHLPAVIERGPKEPDDPWFNAVQLAGELKIAESASALGRWISLDTGGMTGMAIWARLGNQPAAKALSQIGDPAGPVLASILQYGNSEERSAAIRALALIGSPDAKKTLQNQLKREQEPKTKAFIKNILEHWKPAS